MLQSKKALNPGYFLRCHGNRDFNFNIFFISFAWYNKLHQRFFQMISQNTYFRLTERLIARASQDAYKSILSHKNITNLKVVWYCEGSKWEFILCIGMLRPLIWIFTKKLVNWLVQPELYHCIGMTTLVSQFTRLILGLRPANESRSYKVTLSLIGWTQT